MRLSENCHPALAVDPGVGFLGGVGRGLATRCGPIFLIIPEAAVRINADVSEGLRLNRPRRCAWSVCRYVTFVVSRLRLQPRRAFDECAATSKQLADFHFLAIETSGVTIYP